MPGEFCQKDACDAATGACKLKPLTCTGDDATFVPVCGCDGMTYYNPCVAEREAVNVATDGECTSNQATCTRSQGGSSCSPARDRARCYRPRTSCSGVSAANGVCWVLPDECPTEPQVNRYCAAVGGSGSPRCAGLCELLDQDLAIWRDSSECP